MQTIQKIQFENWEKKKHLIISDANGKSKF